jgi:hypothetical protein
MIFFATIGCYENAFSSHNNNKNYNRRTEDSQPKVDGLNQGMLNGMSNYIKGNVPGSKKKQQLTLRWDFLGGNFLDNFLNGIFFYSVFSAQVISSKLS